MSSAQSARSGNAEAIQNPGAIQWTAPPTAFVDSLYRGVLGRAPESQAVVNTWAGQINANPASRKTVFWAFVNSPEYQAKFQPSGPRTWSIWSRTSPNEFVAAERNPGGAYWHHVEGNLYQLGAGRCWAGTRPSERSETGSSLLIIYRMNECLTRQEGSDEKHRHNLFCRFYRPRNCVFHLSRAGPEGHAAKPFTKPLDVQPLTSAEMIRPQQIIGDGIPQAQPQRCAWYRSKLGPYASIINAAARETGIPPQLLAAILLNELADVGMEDVAQDQQMASTGGEFRLALDPINRPVLSYKPIGQQSFGIAQINPATAPEAQRRPHRRPGEALPGLRGVSDRLSASLIAPWPSTRLPGSSGGILTILS